MDLDVLLEKTIDEGTTARESAGRLELERELSEIDAQAVANLAALQQDQATIEELRAIIESKEAAIRMINDRVKLRARQDSTNEERRKEVSRNLHDPIAVKENRDQIRRQVRAELFSKLRPESLDPSSHPSTREAAAADSPNHNQEPRLEGIPEDLEEDDEIVYEQRVRRSSRKRTSRHHHNSQPPSPTPEPQVQSSNASHHGSSGQKRRRLERDEDRTGSSGQSNVAPGARDPIEYDQVYAGGDAIIKYHIFEYPEGSKKWYILRCLEHNMHISGASMQGAAKHLNSSLHGYLARTYAVAFERLSVPVLSCDADKARQNNLAVEKAASSGYKPPQANAVAEHRRQSTRTKGSRRGSRLSRPRRPKTLGCDTVVTPEVGEIYGMTWNERPATVLLLPIGDVSVVSMTGSTITELEGITVPKCYSFSKRHRVYSWANRYRDGEERFQKRKYPVMVFEDDTAIPDYPDQLSLPLGVPCYYWAKHFELEHINLDDPKAQNMEGIEAAKAFRARMEAYRLAASKGDDPHDLIACQDEHSIHLENDPENADEIDDDDDEYVDWNVSNGGNHRGNRRSSIFAGRAAGGPRTLSPDAPDTAQQSEETSQSRFYPEPQHQEPSTAPPTSSNLDTEYLRDLERLHAGQGGTMMPIDGLPIVVNPYSDDPSPSDDDDDSEEDDDDEQEMAGPSSLYRSLSPPQFHVRSTSGPNYTGFRGGVGARNSSASSSSPSGRPNLNTVTINTRTSPESSRPSQPPPPPFVETQWPHRGGPTFTSTLDSSTSQARFTPTTTAVTVTGSTRPATAGNTGGGSGTSSRAQNTNTTAPVADMGGGGVDMSRIVMRTIERDITTVSY